MSRARREHRPPGDDDLVVGRNGVLEALASGGVERVLLADEPGTAAWFAREGQEAARAARVTVARVPRAALDRLAPGIAHQGVAARVTPARVLSLDELLARVGSPALLVLLDGVEDPRNLGAIVRCAAAAGAGVILPERRTAPLNAACSKASAGTLHRTPIARVTNVVRTLELLAESGVWSLGLAAGADAVWKADLQRPTCLVIGGEDRGLSRLVRERCDALAGIPLAPGVDSLNASVACGIGLFEAVRQRQANRDRI